MSDQDDGRSQQELAELRQRIADLEAADHNRKRLEDDLDRTFRLSPMLMCIAGLDGYLKRANPVYQETCGLTQEELLTLPYIESMHPDDRPAFHAVVNQLANGVPVFNVETRMCRPDNSVRSILWTGIPMTEAGTVLCIGQDVTAAKEAEKALRDSEVKFRSLFQHSAVGTAITQDGVSLLHVNPAFCAFLGFSDDELRGKTIQSLCHPDDWEESFAAIRGTLEGGPRTQRFEKRYLHKSGQVLWGEVNFTLVCDAAGKPDYFITQVLDITERKQAEEELAKSKAMLQAAIDCLPFNFFAIGLDGRYMLQNAVSKAYQQADVIGKRPEDICSNKHDLAIWLDNNRRAFAGEKVEGEVTLSLVDEDRSYYNVIVPIRDGDELHGILGVNIDITERKRAEDALQKAHDELEQRVKETRLNEARLEAVLHLSHMTEASEKEITDFALEKAVALTESKIGYVAFMNEDETVLTMHSWSEEAMAECAISDKPLVYPVITTGLWGEAARQRKPIVTNDYPAPNPLKKGIPEGHTGLRRHMNVPIIDEERIVIVAGVGNKEADYNESDVRQLTLLMTGVWTLIQRNRMQAELRQHRDHLEQLVHERTESLQREYQNVKHLLRASDHERQLIAYEIHDGLAQQLAAALMQLQAFDHLKDKTPKDAAKAYDAALTMLRQGHYEARRLIAGVRPPILDESGILEAVAHLVHEESRDSTVKIEYHSKVDFDRLDPTLENGIYRIAQEALANACQYSKSEKVQVRLVQHGDQVRIEIRDWGIGFDPKAVPKNHFGLEGIRQRARLLGGKCSIRSSAGKGTRITVELPVVLRD